MYMDETCSFDPANIPEASGTETAFHIIGEEQQQLPFAAASVLEMELQHQHNQQHHHQQQQQLISENGYNSWQQYQQHLEPAQHDLLNLFHFPTCSPSPSATSSSLTFAASPSPSSSVLYDPLLHLNLPAPHPPPLFHYNAGGCFLGEGSAGRLYGAAADTGLQFENGGVLEFGRDGGAALGRDIGCGRGTKHFASERHRRDQMRDTYAMLRSLVPNPTKNDRASVVGDAIEYIKELRRSVTELKLLVDKKRRGKEGNKRHKPEEEDDEVDGAGGATESCDIKPDPDNYSHIRSSWLQRKSKDTEVDVRIVDDEVTVKLVQRKKINLLLTAARVLDELQLDLRHVAGGHVGDTYSYLFNTKIYEGSSLYASAIANKLIDVLDRQYATITY